MKSFGQCARPWVSGLQIVLEPICEIPLASWQEQLGWVFKRRLFKGTDIVLYTNEDWILNLVTVKSIMEILFTKAEPKIHSFWLLIRRHNTFEIPLGEEIFRVGNSRNTFRVTFASSSIKSCLEDPRLYFFGSSKLRTQNIAWETLKLDDTLADKLQLCSRI